MEKFSFSDISFKKCKNNDGIREWKALDQFGRLVAVGYTKAQCVENARDHYEFLNGLSESEQNRIFARER